MTQVLAFVSGPLVQVASDRLVSVQQGTAIRPWDPDANKAIIFVASDAVVAIGYTGISYIGDTPTDIYLASHFAGQDLSQLSGMSVSNGRRPWPSLGRSVVQLLRALEQAPIRREHLGFAPSILLAGFRWRSGRKGIRTSRGSFRWIIHREASGTYAFHRFPHQQGMIHLSGVPSPQLTDVEVNPYFDAIAALDVAQMDIDDLIEEAEGAAARLVRASADRMARSGTATIGRDVMVISIASPHKHRRVHARHVPDPNDPQKRSIQNVAPWLVSMGTIVAPTAVASGLTVSAPPFQIKFEGPPPPDPDGWSSSAAARSAGRVRAELRRHNSPYRKRLRSQNREAPSANTPSR